MTKKKLLLGGNVNPQYINPINSNRNIGRLQTTLPNMGMQGNLTKAGQLDTSRFNAGYRGINMGAAGTIASSVGSQMQGDEAQDVVSKAGPWGAAIGTISKIGTGAMDSMIDYNKEKITGGEKTAAAIKTGIFNPAAAWFDPNLSGKEKVIGGLLPGLGGIMSAKAKKRKIADAKRKESYINAQQDATMRTSQMVDTTPDVQVMKGGGWIQKAINPSHKGYCTPMSKPTCTGHRRALALRFKKGGDLHKANGGYIHSEIAPGNTKMLEYGGLTHEESPIGGIPVDGNGNITNLGNAKALVEDKEVAWNKGKNDTYIFSDRLGFAKEAKSIMKGYEKRLGKNLDGIDNISKTTMNSRLEDLQSKQEFVKSQLPKSSTNQMANGGNVPDAKPVFTYPDTPERFKMFKESLEADERAKDFARLYHYKQTLDPLLQAKDVKSYSELVKDIPKNVNDRIKLADNAYKEGKYKAYLTPQEIQSTLGDKYEDYVALMNKLQKPEMGVSGTNEQGQPINEMKYGLRSSLSITPYSNVMVNKTPDKAKTKSQFGAQVFYNPEKDGYEYKYEEPKEFKCGGKLPKMVKGGTIPYKNAVPYSTMTPSEGIDYIGRNAVKPIKGLEYKSPAPKGIGSYVPSKTVSTKTPTEKTYLGEAAPIAGSTALSMLGTAYALKNLKKHKAVNLGRITPQQINLEAARESARTSAKEGLANIRSAAKSVGSPNYMNEVISGTIGTQRELGKNLTQSYLAEQTTNAAAREEANRANVAAAAQEAGINLNQMNRYEDTKAGLTSNLFTIPAMGVSEYLGQKNLMDSAQLSGRYKFKTDPKNRFKRIVVAKKDEE